MQMRYAVNRPPRLMKRTPYTPRLASSENPVVRNALDFSKQHLSGIVRSSGDTYFQHGCEVAETLEEVIGDDALTAVALLHDLEEHEHGAALLIQAPVTDEERDLIRRMHGLRRLHIDMHTGDLDRVVGAFSGDPRLLLLRMAHRLNDVRHLSRFPRERQREIAHETLHMYTSISGRLGFQRWRWQMEDICFMTLQPKIAKRMQRRFDEAREVDEACLHHARAFLLKTLGTQGIEAEIDERIKGLYSTYRKMVLKKRGFGDLTDRLALRVLVPTVGDCYRALGIIHASMHPMHGKLKDYIGTPKENGYRSIHTVVYPLPGISELPIEIQIRTHEMHRDCEFGIASHGEYKNWAYALTSAASRANLFRNLESLHSVAKSHRTFTEALRHSFSQDRLLVFDPQNNLYHLPRPSTAYDFACHAMPDECKLINGVRINGRERALDTPLHDGDTVEMLFKRQTASDAQRKATGRMMKKTAQKQKRRINPPIRLKRQKESIQGAES